MNKVLTVLTLRCLFSFCVDLVMVTYFLMKHYFTIEIKKTNIILKEIFCSTQLFHLYTIISSPSKLQEFSIMHQALSLLGSIAKRQLYNMEVILQ